MKIQDIQIFDCEQGTPEWFACRLGIPTASDFAYVLASGKSGGESKTRRTYMLKLLGELMTGEPADNFTNVHLNRGKEMEAAAREAYVAQTGNVVTRTGFVRRGDVGCSPDGLIGENGILEIKTKLPHLQLEVLLKDGVPGEHIAQIQGQIFVTDRKWVDFVSYWPHLPLVIKRVERDDEYIKKLRYGLQAFNQELKELALKVTGKTPAHLKSLHKKPPLMADPDKEFTNLDDDWLSIT